MKLRTLTTLGLTMTCFAMSVSSQAEDTIQTQPSFQDSMKILELLISPEEIKSRITQAAQSIDADYKGEEVTVVMVMKGALCLAADLIRELKGPYTVEFLKASSYGHRGDQRGDLKIIGLEDLDFTSKNILLIDDIFDSGATLMRILEKIQEKNPKTLKSLVLLVKDIERSTSYLPDYVLFEIPNDFVVGYGLDYKEHYRGLPGVFKIK